MIYLSIGDVIRQIKEEIALRTTTATLRADAVLAGQAWQENQAALGRQRATIASLRQTIAKFEAACTHPTVTTRSRLYAAATLETPAEWEQQGTCDICGLDLGDDIPENSNCHEVTL